MNIIKITVLLLLTLTIVVVNSCAKKDLGNYTYKELSDFYVAAADQPASFEVPYGSGRLTIHPEVVYDGTDSLSYAWKLYGSSEPFKIISTSSALDVSLTRPLGQYTLEFSATETSTGRMATSQYSVTITSPYGSGFIIAYEKDGGFDLDLIRSPLLNPVFRDTVLKELYQTANGRSMSGHPIALGQNTASAPPSTIIFPATITIVSSEETTIIDAGNFTEYHNYDDLFFYDDLKNSVTGKPKGVRLRNLIIGNQIYAPLNGLTLQMTGKLTPPDNKELDISNVIFDGYLYDKKNFRFLNVAVNTFTSYPKTTNPAARFSLDSLGPKDLLFLKTGHNMGSGNIRYALFKDMVSESKRYLYLINFTIVAGTNPDRGMVDVSSAPEIQSAIAYELLTDAPVVYYATQNALHKIVVSVDGTSYQHNPSGFELPQGEIITCLKAYNNEKLFVATWNEPEQQGKVYLLPVSFGGSLGQPLQTWGNFPGRITLMDNKLR